MDHVRASVLGHKSLYEFSILATVCYRYSTVPGIYDGKQTESEGVDRVQGHRLSPRAQPEEVCLLTVIKPWPPVL